MWIASFDIGIKNFAFCIISIDIENENIKQLSYQDSYGYNKECTELFKNYLENYIYTKFEIVLIENINLQEESKLNLNEIFKNVHLVLESYYLCWENINVVLIEQQMQFHNNNNIKAIKIAQHIYSHFLIKYPTKIVIEYPAYHKTQVFGAPLKLKKPERKKWAVHFIENILNKYSKISLNNYKKKDDVSDCILMCLAYTVQEYLFRK